MDIPEEVKRVQTQRLDKDEFFFCSKLFSHISKMPGQTRAQKDAVLQWLRDQFTSEFDISLSALENPPKELEIYKLIINKKICYVVFDLLNNNPPNLVPSGVIFPS
jgi:hypothetical protein